MNTYGMKAGPELDALIAEKVFGWKKLTWQHLPTQTHYYWWVSETKQEPVCPRHSSDIAAAHLVWQELAKAGWQCSLVQSQFQYVPEDRWIFHGTQLFDGKAVRIKSFSRHSDTPGVAICLGALDAVKIVKEWNAEHGLTHAKKVEEELNAREL